jgi:hypothetical protein
VVTTSGQQYIWAKARTSGLISMFNGKIENELGLMQSRHDPCVLWKAGCVIVIYTDDTIIAGPNTVNVDSIIKVVEDKFNITSNDSVDDFLGVNIGYQEDEKIVFNQPNLIQSILNDLGLQDNSVTKEIPALLSKILHEHPYSLDFDDKWHYCSVIGKMNYFEKSTRSDIAYAMHQCARFSSKPKYLHGKAVKQIGRYLLATKNKCIDALPMQESLETYADANFGGNWNYEIALEDRNTARSRTGY